MKNLIIGDTSQQSYYYPDEYVRISSRKIDFNFLATNQWDSVYITFAEQRVYDEGIDYINPNYIYVLKLIECLINNCNKIVVFTSCELWNNYTGQIDISVPFSFRNDGFSKYLTSKKMLNNSIENLRIISKIYDKVVIIHPFNFNSVHRNPYFLFGKVFDSIINKKRIEIGDTYFYRDIIHTKYLVKRAIESKSDEIVGSGRLYFVNDYIRDLYLAFDMDYNEYVIENRKIQNNHLDKIYYSYQSKIYTYGMLLTDTISDLKTQM